MQAFGFTNWRFFFGRQTKPYNIGIPLDHAHILRHHEPPLLILEDDIRPLHYSPWVYPPDEFSMLYLGGGRGGDRRGIENAKQHGFAPKTAYHYGYLPIDDRWMRIFGMWYTHAILYTTKEAMHAAADSMTRRQLPIDTNLALDHYRLPAACLYQPMFWQADRHHAISTRHYCPSGLDQP